MPFVEMWMYLETVIQSEVRKRETSHINADIWNLEKWYRCTYLQGRNRDADIWTRGTRKRGWDEMGDWD